MFTASRKIPGRFCVITEFISLIRLNSVYFSASCTYYPGGDFMASYVSPNIRDKFETLSVDLKNVILEKDVQLNTMYDLIAVLEKIVTEGEK